MVTRNYTAKNSNQWQAAKATQANFAGLMQAQTPANQSQAPPSLRTEDGEINDKNYFQA